MPCPSPGEGFGPAYAHDSAPNAWRGTPSAICERVLTAARVCGAAAQSPSNEYNLVAQAAEPFYVTDVGLAMLTMLPTMPTILTEPTMLTVPTVPTILTEPTMLTVLTILTILTILTVPTMLTILTVPTMLTVPTVPTMLTMPTVLTVLTMLTMLTKKASKQDVIPETPLQP